jgi:hypothetical protein
MNYTKEELAEYEAIMDELQSIPANAKNRLELERANLKKMEDFNQRVRDKQKQKEA